MIDTNQYVISYNEQSIILDFGWIELFVPMLDSIVKWMHLQQIKYLFAPHLYPDFISFFGLWDEILDDAALYNLWFWEVVIRHFSMWRYRFMPIADPCSVGSQ